MNNLSKFSVVLLSAGTGRRLGKLGTKYPKCLLKINKKTLLESIIGHLKKRKVKEINMVLGYKSKMIIERVKKIKNVKFNFIKVKDYRKNGHACSWHAFKNKWKEKKLPILLMHTDIFFDSIFLDNIINSKKKNIIGIHSNKHNFQKRSLVVKSDLKNRITQINYIEKLQKFSGEVIGINKISKETAKKIFLFMDKFLVKKNKKLPWEIVLDNYISSNSDSLFVLQNQKYFWVNVNYRKDFLTIKGF